MDPVEAVRDVLRKHEVTFDEYRAGMMHMVKTQEAKEMPLRIDVFLNSTIVEIENRHRAGSSSWSRRSTKTACASWTWISVSTRLSIRPRKLRNSGCPETILPNVEGCGIERLARGTY